MALRQGDENFGCSFKVKAVSLVEKEGETEVFNFDERDLITK